MRGRARGEDSAEEEDGEGTIWMGRSAVSRAKRVRRAVERATESSRECRPQGDALPPAG